MILSGTCELSVLSAQQFIQTHTITTDDGLVSNQFNWFFHTDSRGLTWIGSYHGLSCFDGIEAWSIPVGPLPNQLPEASLQSDFCEDESGDLWFATQSWLIRYDRRSDVFGRIRLIHPTGDTVTTGYDLFHYEPGREQLYLAAGGYLWLYEITTGNYYPLAESLGVRFATQSGPAGGIVVVAIPWLNRNGLEYFQLESDPPRVVTSRIDTSGLPTLFDAELSGDSIVWVTSANGLGEYDIRKGQLLNWHRPSGMGTFVPSSIRRDGSDQLLVTNSQGMLVRFNTHNRSFYPLGQVQFNTMVDNEIDAFETATDGYGWASLTHGVVFFRLPPNEPESVHCTVPESFLLRGAVVGIVALNEESSQIGIATSKRGVYLLENDSKDWSVSQQHGLPKWQELMHSFVDPLGRWWLVYRSSLWCLEHGGTNWKMVSVPENAALLHGVSTDRGRILIISGKKGILEVQLDSIPACRAVPALEDFGGLVFSHLYIGKGGTVYAASKGSLVHFIFEGLTGLEVIGQLEIGSQLYCVYELPDTELVLLGTAAGLRLARYSSEAGIVELVATPEWAKVLNGTPIHAITADRNQNLWISTNKGLWKKEPSNEHLIRFRKEDGLPSEQYNPFAALFLQDADQIWLGTNEGIHAFCPEDLKPYPHASRPYILDLSLPGGPFRGDTVIGEKTFLELPFRENTLAFSIRALTRYLADENQVHYRLINYDSTWVEVRNGETARFTKVPPGRYELEYKAVNANGLHSDIHRLDINIRPPFYATIWFRTMVLLALAGIAYLIIRSIIRRKLREKEIIIQRQEALQAERNRIAGELHDDLGSGLSVIRFISDELGFEESDPERKEQIRHIATSAAGLVERMRDIIWALNTENDQLNDLILFLRRYAVSYLSANKIECQVQIPDEIPDREVKGERRRNVLLILKEALHNVVKSADANHVKINIEITDRLIQMTVTDDGVGMPTGPVRTDAYGLKNMRKRVHPDGGAVEWLNNQFGGTTVLIVEPLPKT